MNRSAAPSVALPKPTRIELHERATTAVYDSGAPTDHDQGQPPVVLLHGWCVNAYVNFGAAYEALAKDHRIIMIDLRGHGLGADAPDGFRLETCVDDVLGVLDHLAVERAIIVGYSLGGAVAQLLARQAPDWVAGVVLASTTEFFCGYLSIRWQFRGLELCAAALKRLPSALQKPVFHSIATIACVRYPGWVRSEVLRNDPVAMLEAGASLGSFDSVGWVGELEMPVAVVVTARDRVIPADSQYRLADDTGAVLTITIDADHDIPVRNDPRFAEALGEAIRAVSTARRPRQLNLAD